MKLISNTTYPTFQVHTDPLFFFWDHEIYINFLFFFINWNIIFQVYINFFSFSFLFFSLIFIYYKPYKMMVKNIILFIFLFISTSHALDLSDIFSLKKHQVKHKFIVESDLPKAEQTHEIVAVPKSNVVLISQMSNSVLVKAKVDHRGVIRDLYHFQMGTNTSGLHGLANSKQYPGKIWITLQEENKLLLIDPKPYSLSAKPTILKTILVPGKTAKGPHYIGEYGDDLWVSLKDSFDVLRINHRDTSNYNVFHGFPHPIFIAEHPINKLFYASEDDSSHIVKIDPKTDKTKQFAIPKEIGATPVGLISGPKGIWFTLLGSRTNGTGTIGYIDEHDKFTFMKLKSPLASTASFLHLAFDVNHLENHTLWLLASSINYPNALNMLIKVTFDDQWKTILTEDITVIPTQYSAVHRILPTKTNIFVTELSTSKLFSLY
ncbi:unnamed protein product [Cunninghamella blakesleeana]